MKHPTFGYVSVGGIVHAVHAHAADHMPGDTRYQRFNKRMALIITQNVGTMTCAWIFCFLALASLPATLFAAGVIGQLGFITGTGFILVVSWAAQSFIQLVLLPAIMVGQNIQAEAGDARAAKQFQDVEKLLDLMDTHTEGGLQEVMALLTRLAHPQVTLTRSPEETQRLADEFRRKVQGDNSLRVLPPDLPHGVEEGGGHLDG